MGDVYSLFQQESFLICSVLTLITALVHVLFQYSECEHVTSPHPSAASHHHQQPTDYQTTIFPAPIGHCQKFDLYGFFEGQILQELPLSPTSSGAL
jgi:hypothetical protein